MSQTAKIYYTMREVAGLLGVASSTLRYWEKEFPQLAPERTESGQRRYTAASLETAKRIKELLHERGLKIEAAKEIIGTKRKHPPRNSYVCADRKDAVSLLCEAAKMAGDNMHAVDRIEAVERWLRSQSD